MKPKILFIDDDPRLLEGMQRRLRRQAKQWAMTFENEPEEAWRHLQDDDFDAVVCDIMMPRVSGFELLERIAGEERTRDVPVVMISGADDDTLKRKSLRLGAIDLITKPVDHDELVIRLEYMLKIKLMRDELAAKARKLAEPETPGNIDDEDYMSFRAPYLSCLYRIAKQCDTEADDHITRVGWYSREIAAQLGLDHDTQERIFWAAPLHDIGKVGIPSSILQKRGKLTPGEWVVMQKHCAIGERILRGHATDVLAVYGMSNPEEVLGFGADSLLAMAATISLTHHEKWNGSGYPLGLREMQIPLESRIVMVADVFDSMITERPYHEPAPVNTAYDWIRHLGGQFFDPAVIDAFEKSFEHIKLIYEAILNEGLLDSSNQSLGVDFGPNGYTPGRVRIAPEANGAT